MAIKSIHELAETSTEALVEGAEFIVNNSASETVTATKVSLATLKDVINDGSTAFDPTAITGYDATKKQVLFEDNGTLKWKTRKIGYTNFLQDYNYILANSACPASYTSLEQIIKVSICQRLNETSYSQCITNSSVDNAVVGIGNHSNQGDKFKLYDGNEHLGNTSVTSYLQTYWIKAIADGDNNCSLYTLIDNSGAYTIDTLPEISQFTQETSSTNWTLANKTFSVGISNQHNGTMMTVYEVQLFIDDVKVFDLQDPSGYKVYGNVRTLYWYE